MPLIVEDGTGVVDANALISLAWFKSWADERGKDYSEYSDTQIEQAIVRASEFLSESFRWKGYRLKERGDARGMQAMAFPRTNLTDYRGYSYASDEVPIEVEKATAEVVMVELAEPGTMQPRYDGNQRVKRERFGSVEFEYNLPGSGAEAARPVLLAVRDLIGDMLDGAAGSAIAGAAVRA